MSDPLTAELVRSEHRVIVRIEGATADRLEDVLSHVHDHLPKAGVALTDPIVLLSIEDNDAGSIEMGFTIEESNEASCIEVARTALAAAGVVLVQA